MPEKIEKWACAGCHRIHNTEEACLDCEALCLGVYEAVKTAKIEVYTPVPNQPSYMYDGIRDGDGCPLAVVVSYTSNGKAFTRTYHLC
jgi:hypothetical protein